MFRQILPTIGRGFYDLWDNLMVLVVANLAWSLSLIPALLVAYLPLPSPFNLLAILIIFGIAAGPATAGLFYLAADIRREERVELGDFWRGIRLYWQRGLVLMFLNIVFLVVVYFNLVFYNTGQFNGTPFVFLAPLWLYIAVAWLILQMYVWPLAVRSVEDYRLSLVFRNALLATFKYPLFSLPIGLFLIAMTVASFLFLALVPMVLFGTALVAVVSNRALTNILKREREVAAARENAESPTNQNSTASSIPANRPKFSGESTSAILSRRNTPNEKTPPDTEQQ